MGERRAKRVLLIGWDAADWQMIEPLMADGQMPNLKRLTDTGVRGNIATLHPVLSPMLWNSIGTGKLADKHQILGFTEPDGQGGVRPVSSTSRKAKAFWNILSQNGLRSIVVNWFASHPAEHIRGCVVTDRYPKTNTSDGTQFEVDGATVWPPELVEDLREVRVGINDLVLEQAQAFVPRVAEVDSQIDIRPGSLAHLLAECASTHNAATQLIETQEWDVAAVYYDSIDHFGHAFMEYHPPRMAHVTPRDFEIYRHAMASIYQYHDMMLGRLLQLAGEETTVMLISDHGFQNGALRPPIFVDPATGKRYGPGMDPVAWHRSHGVFVCSGPGIRRGEEVFGLSLLDVTPTLLTLMGVPVGKDMDGTPAMHIFEQPPPASSVGTHEGEHPDDGVYRGEFRDDPYAAQEVLKQLAELGYVEAATGDAASQLEGVMNDRERNLAQVYMSTGRFAQAMPILRSLVARHPGPVHRTRLALCLMQNGDLDEARELLTGLGGDAQHAPIATLMLGDLNLRQKRYDEAEKLLESVLRSDPMLAGLHLALGSTYLAQRRWAQAESAFRKALELNADDSDAHDGLGVALREQRRYEDAIFHHMKSASLMHRRATTHVNLGIALVKGGKVDWGIRAFEVASELAPKWARPQRCLYQTYKRFKADREKAAQHMMRAIALRTENIQAQSRRALEGDTWM